MKLSSCLLLAVFFIVVLASSCRKAGTSPGIYVPWDLDTLMYAGGGSGSVQIISVPPWVNADGAMILCETQGSLTDTGANTSKYLRRWGAAQFAGGYAGEGGANAGEVSVNSVKLSFVAKYPRRYERHDTMMAWNNGGFNHWHVEGAGGVPPVSADIEGALPSFRDVLPTTISKTSDFSLAFNASNTVNGDMAYVIIYSQGKRCYSNVVSTNGGTATIKAADLKNAKNEYLQLSGFYDAKSPMPVYYGGFIVVVIYSNNVRTFGGKQFALVKQRVALGNVTFF
ncbi:MAG: hypothetical protein K0Q79_1030 [Flavipsychrobacter sp.]|jgi:hypothetical protein|nr:hypothetical protein [Flavipsychrobacter sp.]